MGPQVAKVIHDSDGGDWVACARSPLSAVVSTGAWGLRSPNPSPVVIIASQCGLAGLCAVLGGSVGWYGVGSLLWLMVPHNLLRCWVGLAWWGGVAAGAWGGCLISASWCVDIWPNQGSELGPRGRACRGEVTLVVSNFGADVGNKLPRKGHTLHRS